MHAAMKLGRVKPTPDQRKRALPLKHYLRAPLPPGPAEFHGATGAAIGMWGNDRAGNCTFAGLANLRAIIAALFGLPAPPTTLEAVLKAYFAFTNGKDEGAVEGEVLNAAVKGVQLDDGEPFQLTAWATVDLNDVALCRSVIALFGALYLGVELPLAAQSGGLWKVPANFDGDNKPDSWGGHCLLWSGWNKQNVLDLVTWGIVQPAEDGWQGAYGDEAHVLLPSVLAQRAGVKFDELVADMAALQ